MLHSDIALLVPGSAMSSGSRDPTSRPGAGPESVIEFSDGRQLGVQKLNLHWEVGRALLDLVGPDPSKDPFVRLWYLATASFTQRLYQFAYAMPQIARALDLFPQDPDVLLLAGSVHEIFGSSRVQSLRFFIPSWTRVDFGEAEAEWRKARASFAMAVEADPSMGEARVRLGRVTGLLGDHAKAVDEIQRGLANAADPRLQYYALLFLGDELQALGRRAPAREAYERAAALYPAAQSPRLALSRLARRYGDRAAALRALEPVFARSGEEAAADDPWWSYYAVPLRDLEAMFGGLKTALASTGQS
jgi:tetratricopeptide (TPR) repeat protein